MNKQEFLKKLSSELKGISKSAVSEALSYYDEIICDKMEAGKSEIQAVEEVGNVDIIVSQLKKQLSNRKCAEDRKSFTKLSLESYVDAFAVENYDGKILFEKSEDDRIHIMYHQYMFRKFDVETEGNKFIFKYRKRSLFKAIISELFWITSFYKKTIRVAVPESFNGAIDVSTQNGKIFISSCESLKRLSATTSNGSVVFSDCFCEGNVELKSGNGRVVVRNLTTNGRVEVDSSNGRLVASNVDAENIELETSNGRLLASNIHCSKIEARTSNGKIVMNDIRTQDIFAKTSNGRIEILKLYSPIISAQTSNGKIDLSIDGKQDEYNLQGKVSNGHIQFGNLKLFSQNFDNGLPKHLKLRTSNGSANVVFLNDQPAEPENI